MYKLICDRCGKDIKMEYDIACSTSFGIPYRRKLFSFDGDLCDECKKIANDLCKKMKKEFLDE